MTSQSLIETAIRDGIALHQRLLDELVPLTNQVAEMCLQTFERGGRIFFAGNGGSAAEAQHIATEFVVRFKHQRRSLPVIALTTDTSIITATGNDFDFDQIFARQVEALVRPNDMFVGLSTSGNSPNISEAVKEAHKRGATTVGFTGNRKGPLVDLVDLAVEIPSSDTQRIQEAHLVLWHIICELVDVAVAAQDAESE